MAAIKFSKQNIQPNPLEVDYWVDITSNPYGGNIKYHNGYDWVDLLNSKGTPINLDAYYNKVLMNQMLAGKASVESVDSKVDDTEVADVIKNIEFKDRGDDGVEMVVLKYNDMTVGVTLPVASNTTSGIITNKSFKDLVKQNQLQGVYSEMYDKLSEIRQQYQRKLKAGKNIQIDSDNTIHAVGEISLDWDDVYNKPDFDKLFATVALAIQSESTRAKNAEQQLSARITDHVDVVEGKLDLKADASSVYTKDQIDEKISGIYKIKGSRTFQDLPTSGNTIGDVYNITNNFALDGVEYPLGTNVVYTATGWDALAGIFDSTEIENKVDEIDTKVDEEIIRAKEKELELDKKFDGYLPLSGGTLYKSEDNPIVTFKNNYSPAYINFKSNYANGGDGSLGIISKQLKYIGSDSQAWNTVLHEGNYSNYALPLTGGTLTSNGVPLTINRTGIEPKIGFQTNGSTIGYIGFDVSENLIFQRGNLYKIYHEGNFNPSDYLPLSGGKLTGNLQIGEETTDNTYTPGIYLWKGDGTHSHRSILGTVNDGLSLSYYNPTASKYGRLKINETGMYFTTDGSGLILGHKIWHEGNDGSDSGLDADLLDGLLSNNFARSHDSVGANNIKGNALGYTYVTEEHGGKHTGGIISFGTQDYYCLLNGRIDDYCLSYRYHYGDSGTSNWKDIAFTDYNGFYNLYGGTEIPAGANLNDYNTPGTYHCRLNNISTSLKNCPTSVAFIMVVKHSTGDGNHFSQHLTEYNLGKQFYRNRVKTGDWGSWKLIATDLETYNAPTATKATQDSEGNVITDTYALKSDLIIGLDVTDGVYAVKTDGSLCTIDEADTSCTGVALIAGEHKFMITKSSATYGTYNMLYWGKNLYGKDVAGVVTNSKVNGINSDGYLPKPDGSYYSAPNLSSDFTTWTAGALSDFNGKANTAAIIAAYTEHGVSMDARDMCSVLNTFNASDSYKDWYVPACGQLALMYLNMTEINATLTKIGGTALVDYHWSSSEYSSSHAWEVYFGNGSVNHSDSKNFSYCRVRFIRDIQIESSKSIKESIIEIKDQLKQPASSALKLATPVKLWGNDFDGSNSVDGSVYFKNNSHLHIADNQNNPTSVLVYNDSNLLALGYSSSGKGHKTSVYGSPIDFCTGTDRVGRMIIDNNGNVGIGTTNPGHNLDVIGSIRASKQIVSNEGFVVSNNKCYYTIDSKKNWVDSLTMTSGDGLVIGSGTTRFGYHTYIDGTLVNIRTSQASKPAMIINPSGNVTIGSSDLAGTNHKLHVAGQGVFDGGIYGPSLAVHSKISSGELVDWYGVSWSENDSDPTCTRIGNAALHRSLPILSAMKGYCICNKLTGGKTDLILPMDDAWIAKYGADGNSQIAGETRRVYTETMVKIPEFWYIDDYEPSTKTHNLKISQTAKAGWCHHKEAYVGAYEGYNNGTYYRSTKNVIPTVSVTRKGIREIARANGYEDEYKWNIYTYEEHRAICHLFLVEYATRNSQLAVNTALTTDGFKQGGLGSGCTTGSVTINGVDTYSFIPTGTTDSLGNGSGQVAYTVTQTDADGNEIGTVTKYANRYRGIENPFGHIWKHVDDIVNVYNAETTYKTVYKCNKPEHFATNKNAKYKPLCSFPGGSKMQGWSKEIKATINCDFFKYSVGGSESTYWCDYNYDNDDTSEHCLLIGGSSDHGGWSGLFLFYLDHSVGGSLVLVGSRLTYLPWAE